MKATTRILFAAALAFAGMCRADTYVIPKTDRAIRTDGVILPEDCLRCATFCGAADWRTAARTGKPAVADPRKCECSVTWTDEALHVFVRSETGSGGSLVAAGPRDNCGKGDSVEVWIAPPKEMRVAEFARFGQFQLVVEWTGRTYLRHHNPGYGLPARLWKGEGVQCANSIRCDVWDCEIAIPAKAFGAAKMAPGEWGVLIGRNFRSEPSAQKTLTPFTNGTYVDEALYPRFALSEGGKGSVVGGQPEMLGRSVPPTVPANITVRVRAEGPVPAKAYRRYLSSRCKAPGYFGLQQGAGPDGRQGMLLFYHGVGDEKRAPKNFTFAETPPAGEETVYSVNIRSDRISLYVDGALRGEVHPDVELSSDALGEFIPGGGAGGAQIMSFRVRDRLLSEDEIKAEACGDRGVAGTLKWYPSECLVAAELTFPEEMLAEGRPRVDVFAPDGRRLQSFELPRDGAFVKVGGKRPAIVVHDRLRLSAFPPEGICRMTVTCGKDAKPAIDRTFLAKRYEWFKSPLGREESVLPGFEPLKAANSSGGIEVSCVGRRYEIGGNGLPSGMTSLGKSILAGPVSLVVERGGKRAALSGGRVELRRTDPAVVEYASRGGDVRVNGRIEQDGLIVLRLGFPEGFAADRAYLEVVLRKEFAVLYHACGEGLRTNPAGFVPPGTGRVFGSRQIPQSHSDNFIPYCWVGDDLRGVLYAADVDRGWVHSAERDAVELLRRPNGDVAMRLNVLNAPPPGSPRRVVTVCLQATPLKPQPRGCRGWADTFTDVPCTRACRNLASNPTWGCYIVGMARYPTFMDFDHVRKLRETVDTGVIDLAYKSNWIERCWAEYRRKSPTVPWLLRHADPSAARKTLEAHVGAEFHTAKQLHGRPNPTLYYYTCDADPCTGIYEGEAMRDEWGDYTSVYGSHQDYAVHYLKKMIEAGMDGVYNDNAFFRCNYDWVTGDAWIDEKGVVHPSFSLWALREFCRRQVAVMAECGKDPWLTIHHTNANILPTLAFATNMMGMEWKYGTDEFQDRFSDDYIRAVNQGLQGGFFATSLGGIINAKSKEERTWLTRTELATLLPHEVRPTLGNCDGELFTKVMRKMQDFGIAAEDCRYTAYWDKENPLVQPAGAVVSVYRRGRRLLAVVGGRADADATLRIALRDGEVASATNAETGAALDVSGGAASLPLRRRDFALLELESK